MEINKHLQTCIRTAFRNLYRCFHVIITAAVSVSFTVIWIIPHTHTNIGNPAVVFKEFTEIRYIIDHISIEILICHSAVEFRNHRRDVQSHNEIFTEILYLFYIDISLYIPLRIIFPGIRSLSFSYCKRNHRSGQFIAVRLQLSHDIIVPDTRKSHIHLENLSAVVAEHRINQTIFISDCPLIRPPPQVNTFCPKISNLCIPFEYFCRKVNRVSCFRGSIVRRNFNTVHIRSVRFVRDENGNWVFDGKERDYGFAEGSELADETKAAALLSYYEGEFETVLNEEVGYAEETISTRELVSIATESLYRFYKRDSWYPEIAMSIVNTGCARQDIVDGTITYGDVYASFPFDNDHIFAYVDGSDMSYVSRNNATYYEDSNWVKGEKYLVVVISYVYEKATYIYEEVGRDSVNRLRDVVSSYFLGEL